MKVKTKILLIVIPLIFAFLFAANMSFYLFFRSFVLQQEEDQIQKTTNSLVTYISETLARSESTANDWGHWDDTYVFIETGDPEYIEYNLVEDTYSNIGLSFLIMLNNADETVYRQYYSLADGVFTEFPDSFDFSADTISMLKEADDVSGIVRLGDGYYFLSSSDVTDSLIESPANGKLVMGRAIDAPVIASIENVTGSVFGSISDLANPEEVFTEEQTATVVEEYVHTGETVHIDMAFPNEYRIQDSVQINIELPRTLYTTSMRHTWTFGFINAGLCIAIGIIVILVLTNNLSKPFEKLLRDVYRINPDEDHYTRIEETGSKEFRFLRRSINKMLQKIEENQEKIVNMALYDQLTGIPNRRLFIDTLQKNIHASNKAGSMLGVVFIDLDDFKTINDTLGHEAGDELIRQVSRRLSGSIRKDDTVARFGGDEFLLILNNMSDFQDLQNKMDAVMEAINKPYLLEGKEYTVSCSAGISVFPSDGTDSEPLIRNADMAMYHAKKRGKNAYTYSSVQLAGNDLEMDAETLAFLQEREYQ